MEVNKVVYGNSTIIDLTSDTVTPSTILSGYTAHDKAGSLITGNYVPVEDRFDKRVVGRFNSASYFYSESSVPGMNSVTINAGAFMATEISYVEIPYCTEIHELAFANTGTIKSVSLPECSYIGYSAFFNCANLSFANFPKVTVFQFGSSSTGLYSPRTFQNCIRMSYASFPEAIMVPAFGFLNCSSLASAYFPKAKSIYTTAFGSCKNLKNCDFTEVELIQSNAFNGCSSLQMLSFPHATTIAMQAFRSCFLLTSFYLMGSSIPTLVSTAFMSTPIGGYSAKAGQYGSIFVPASLAESYKAAAGWSYFSSRIVGI